MPPENLLYHLRLARAQQAVVDKNAGELGSDCLVQQSRRHARVHPAAQAEHHVLLPDLGADFLHGLLEVAAHGPAFAAPANPVDKVGDDFAAARRVHDLGMKLQAEKFLGAVLNRRIFRVFRDRHGLESVGELGQLVSVGVPDLERLRQLVEQSAAGVLDRERALAVFALEPFLHPAAEKLREQLHAKTDAQHRHAQVEDVLIRQRRILGVHAGRAAGQDDALGLEPGDLRGGRVEAQDLGIDVALADAAGNHLGVLGAEIEEDDLFVHGFKNGSELSSGPQAFASKK